MSYCRQHMKKFFAISIIYLLCLSKIHAATVYFCSDNVVTGSDGNYTSTTKFKIERFKMLIDLANNKVVIDDTTFNRMGDKVLNIFATDYGAQIRFFKEGNKLGYHRSNIFGMSDAIYVASGSCENF